MDGTTVADLFDQIVSGEDIPKIEHLLKRISPENAARLLPGTPYSLLTNLAHADFWQKTWLSRIEGGKRPQFKDDWRVPPVEEFESLRASFLGGLRRAREIAHSWPVPHNLENDDRALHVLVSLAVHDAYHIGQMKLIQRMVELINHAE